VHVIPEVAKCRVCEVMGTELYTLTADTVVASARRLASDNGIEHLLVLDAGTLTGIVCQEDLEAARPGDRVSDCMSTPVLCIAPETTLEDALQIMIEQQISCLPVVNGIRLVGMVTRSALEIAAVDEEATPHPQPLSCGACGAAGPRKRVRRDLRTGGIPICASCLARTIYSFDGDPDD
jgi:CBS domain-containing protein